MHRLVLDLPPVMTLNSAFLDLQGVILNRLQAGTTIKAVILTSNIKVLSAGMGLKEALGFDLKDQQAMVRSLNVNFTKLFGFPKPTIVAASGAAIAGGFFLVLASDYRIASLKARFGLAEVRVGANFPVGPLAIARATLAPNDLRRLMLGGHPIGAEAALAAGIVDIIEDGDAVMARVQSGRHSLTSQRPARRWPLVRSLCSLPRRMPHGASATAAEVPSPPAPAREAEDMPLIHISEPKKPY